MVYIRTVFYVVAAVLVFGLLMGIFAAMKAIGHILAMIAFFGLIIWLASLYAKSKSKPGSGT